MKHSITGKHIVITGASTGIGELIAYKVAEKGAIPILLARNYHSLQQIAAAIKEKYDISPHYYQLDIRDLAAVQLIFHDIFEKIGTIDALVNNAGFGVFDDVVNTDLEQMKAMFEVNVFGLIACTKIVLPKMLAQSSGHIINIASIAGKLATPKSSVYSASKHAVLGFTNSLRMELAAFPAIHVTAVNPGPIKTRFFDIADSSGNYVKNVEKFMLEPDYVASKVVAAMFTRKREINLPRWMNVGSTIYQLMPAVVEKVGGNALFKK